ncbi:MAG: hypothetical protein KA339_02455 [Candidatus Kapabacteria bacterium]|nr:hypothetical protein [Candidatus Kapabacteria bacterium]MBP7094107.1 hypothetical protein [Candidatus Kapabacteria bacterium]
MRIILVIVVVASALLTGCLRSSMSVLVRKDGTAVVTDTLMLTPSTLKMWEEMAKATKTPLQTLLKEQWSDSAMYAEASKMGPGVSVRSVKFVKSSKGAGYVAIYDAKDIGTLSISKNAFHEHMNTPDPSKKSAPSYVRFTRVGSRVTVNNMPLAPEPKNDSAATPSDEELRQQLTMVKKFMTDLEIAIRIVVEPGIASTDATYVQQNTITVIDLPFNKIIARFEKDPSVFRIMQGIPTPEPWSLERGFNSLGTAAKMETKEVFSFEMK